MPTEPPDASTLQHSRFAEMKCEIQPSYLDTDATLYMTLGTKGAPNPVFKSGVDPIQLGDIHPCCKASLRECGTVTGLSTCLSSVVYVNGGLGRDPSPLA